MLQRAARLAAGEESEEAWYLVHLFQRTQPRELLRICHFTLATFLELDYEYFDEGWPLQSRLESSVTCSPTVTSPACQRGCVLKGKGERFRPRSPTPVQKPEATQRATPGRRSPVVSQTSCPAFTTPKSTPGRLAWLKGKSLLPSKLSVFAPNSSPAPASDMGRSVSVVAPSTAYTNLPHAFSYDLQFPSNANKRPEKYPHCENPDYILCRYIADFMHQSPELLSTEGLFRRPGSLSRTKQLYSQLKHCLTSRSASDCNYHSERRAAVYSLLNSALVYDVASVLLRCLSSTHAASTSDSGLIPPRATDLFVKATRLQYHLKNSFPFPPPEPPSDWVHLLCHGRQLLTYRIIVQLLLPTPERQLLLKLLSLLHKIASNTLETRMTSEALARCLAVAVFGIPNSATTMGHYIDTLINLIELFEDLETLPKSIYQQVRSFLKSKLGASPMKSCKGPEANQTVCSPALVDRSALKRSWATCQLATQASPSNLSSTPNGKEVRPFLLSHLCLWSKMSPDGTRDLHSPPPRRPLTSLDTTNLSRTPSGASRQRVRAASPFLKWKKQRSALSIKKSKSLCLSIRSTDTNDVVCG